MADGGGLENRYGVTPIVGSNPTPSARRPGPDRLPITLVAPRSNAPDTPRRATALGVINGPVTVFTQVNAPLVDKAAAREAGHRPRTDPLATIG